MEAYFIQDYSLIWVVFFFVPPRIIFLARFMIRQKENTGKISAKRGRNLCENLPENTKVWNFKEGYV